MSRLSLLRALWLGLLLVFASTGCRSTLPTHGTTTKSLTADNYFGNATAAWNAWLDEKVSVDVKSRPLWLLLSEHPAFSSGNYAIRSRRAYDEPITLHVKDETRRVILLRLAKEHQLMLALLPPYDPERLEIISR
jgi:hypothetical protein